METLQEVHSELHKAEILLIEANSDLEILTERNSAVKDLLEQKRRELVAIVAETNSVQAEAKRLLDMCKNIMATQDEAQAEFFRTLPEGQTSEELENEIESEKARLELMHEGNGGVIKEFEQRQKKIDQLKLKVQDWSHALEELDVHIKEIRGKWEPELDSLIKKISESFAYNMKQINCAGEVSIFKDEADFDQWAIQIQVKFRWVGFCHYERLA